VTLVLGIRCVEGAVLASDGQVTSDAAGQPTRSEARKLFASGGGLAWGAAGSGGLQQTLHAHLDAQAPRGPEDVETRRARLAGLVIPVQRAALHDFVPLPGASPPELECLFAWHDGTRGRLLSVPRTGSDHLLHDRFAAIGSGDIFAAAAVRPFVAPGVALLSLEQAKLVALRAVADAIEVAAVYLGPPIQMVAVTAGGAHAVPREELETGLRDAVELWRERQREDLGPLAGGAAARALAPRRASA